jgi:hypothetical protein
MAAKASVCFSSIQPLRGSSFVEVKRLDHIFTDVVVSSTVSVLILRSFFIHLILCYKQGWLLVTGLLLQVCLAALLAHVGAWVPAEEFELTPVDAIFVRMGARDAIMSGQVSAPLDFYGM